jgi:hypothetical protein
VYRRRFVSLLDRLDKTLGFGAHIAPDTAIVPMPREFHSVVPPVFMRDVPERGMPQDMREDLEVLLRREVGVDLLGHASQDDEPLGAVEPLASAGAKDRPSPAKSAVTRSPVPKKVTMSARSLNPSLIDPRRLRPESERPVPGENCDGRKGNGPACATVHAYGT